MDNPEFEGFYRSLFAQRWPRLSAALRSEAPAFPYSEGLLKPYYLDSASVLAAQSLRLPDEGLVLDACAAPGGKSLVLASRMKEGVSLLANELSRERRRRLREVLDSHLDAQRRQRVRISGFDAAAQGGRRGEWGRFAAVLLDAPCSSEAHVMGSPAALAAWTPARPRILAARQWSLLSAAFLLLRSGGSLVYVTCALSSLENDGVAGRLLAKYPGQVILDPPDFPQGEKTAYGRLILPDAFPGMGPIYVTRFTRQ